MKKKKKKLRLFVSKKETRKRQTKKEVRERLLRRWRGTQLEVKTLSEMWVHERPWHFNPPAVVFTTTRTAGVKSNRFSGTFSTL